MASLNKVLLLGNLTKDPEVRYLSSGTAVGDLRLAVTETFRNKEGATTETTCFVDVVVWGRQAETCGEYLRKGSQALVDGRLQLDEWKSKEGENRSKLRVRADRVQFLGRPAGAGAVRDGGSEPHAAEDAGREEPVREDSPPAAREAGPAVGDDDNLPF